MTEMQRNCMLLAAAVLTTLPTLLPAQEPAVPPGATRDRARAERDQVRALALGYKYGRIGGVVRTDADGETDKGGAKIEGVSPGGPAEKAGLVVKAPRDSSLSLKGGDVILSIGGRKPTSPSHAMRILRSYEKGETVSIDILRKQKRVTVAWRVPARETRMFRRHEEHGGDEEQSGWRGVRRWRVRGWRPLRLQRV